LLLCALLLTGCAAGSGSATGAASPTPARAADESPAARANGAPAGAAAAAVTPPTPAAGTAARQGRGAEESARYEGFYEVLGERPRGFEQFGNFMIRAPEGGRISGAVAPTEGRLYEFDSASLEGERFAFTTRQVGGVSYSFEGRFLASPPFAGGKGAAVARGTVRKYRGGKQEAEAEMSFYYDEGGEG
jgi:hypothetical protein